MDRRPAYRCRDGLTLVELLVSIIIFAVAINVAGRFIIQFAAQVGTSEAQAQAVEFALEELERMKLLPADSIVAKPAAPVPEDAQFMRSVDVRLVGGGPVDVWAYQIITVRVAPPEGIGAVELSTAIAQ